MIYWQTKNWQKSFNFPRISQAFASSPPCDWLPPDKNNGQKLLVRSSTLFQSETSLLSNPSNIRRGAKVSCKLPILIWRGIDGWTLGLARTQSTLLILAYLLIPVSLSLPWLQLLWPALQQAVFPLCPIFTEACSTHYLWEWSSQFSQIIATIRSKLFQRIKIDTLNTFPLRMGIVMLPACKM